MIYDFDKTLSVEDVQNYAFFPMLGMSPKEFWRLTDEYMEEHWVDDIVAYLHLMISESGSRGIPLTRDLLNDVGKDVEFHPGVKGWFSLMNGFCNGIGADVEHYVISSGVRETIMGTSISNGFTDVFACEYLYDEDGVAIGPKTIVNRMGKAEKVLDIGEHIPFENMVYIGDGETDIPCMDTVRSKGGHSIAVYSNDVTKGQCEWMLHEGHVDHIAPADYREGKELYSIVSEILLNRIR